MPTPSETLTDAFRQAEARRAALTAAAVAAYWRARVNADDPASIERWLAAVVPVIMRERNASAVRGALYGNTIRALEVGLTDGFRFDSLEGALPTAAVEQAIRTSLTVTGPVALRRRIDKISGREVSPAEEKALLSKAFDQSGAGAAAAAVRHVQNGGREALIDGVQRDKKALGYVRVTREHPCYFCALLASRGAVYKADSFEDSDSMFDGPGKIKVHDSCQCSLAPLYRRDDPLLDRSKAFLELYTSSTRGKSGREAIKAFRREYEARG
jgi:hypothetical protein